MFAFVLTGCSEVGQILEQSVSEALGVPSGSFNEPKTGTASALDRTSSQNTRFSGSYSGEAMEDTGLFLELLEIRQSANEYNLTLYQNAQNFEEGMSRPSNTKFTQGATGRVQSNVLYFKYNNGEGGGKVFVNSGGTLVCEIDGTKFKLAPSL